MIKRRAAPPPPADRGRATDAAAATPAAGTPWLVWHRAGDNQASWRRALASSADYLEIDVWLQGRRIASHHDPLLHRRLPFLTQQHRLPRLRLPGRGLWLDDADARGRVFLDIKDPPGRRPCPLCCERSTPAAAATVPSPPPPTGRSSIAWYGWRPTSAGSTPSRAPPGNPGDVPRGTHSPGPLISAAWPTGVRERVCRCIAISQRRSDSESCRRPGCGRYCYPINDFQEGRRLLRWGAGGLTSDRAGLIQRWRDQWARGD